jgi:hypothetical protein
MGQAPDGGRIDIYYQNGNLVVQNGQTLCAEPPVGVWVHVAIVNNAGSGTVYYNGVAQSATGNFGNYGQTQDLYIGKRGNNAFQYFNGKLTNIRILNSAYYGSNFVPELITTAVAGHTKLLLTPTVDTIYGFDEGNLGLAIASSGATYSSEYPTEYIYNTAHTVNPSWTNDMFGADSVFIQQNIVPPQVGWIVTDGVNVRTIVGTGYGVNSQNSGFGPMWLLQLNSEVNFNSAATLTLIG